MRLRTQAVMRNEPFPRSSNFNPWTLANRSADTTSSHMEQIGAISSELRFANRHFDVQHDLGELFLINTRGRTYFHEEGSSISEYFTSSTGPVTALSGTESVNSTEHLSLPDPLLLNLPLGAVLEKRESVRQFSGE